VKIGFLINPIAGMGGAVGLKGTDKLLKKAIELGAKPVAFKRAKEFLKKLDKEIEIFTASGQMGEKLVKEFKHNVVYNVNQPTKSKDTENICRKLLEKEVELIAFCGGDGTARDIYNIVGDKITVVGVPSGVKMHSAIFAINPHTAAELINMHAKKRLPIKDAEVMDVDEKAYRKNILKTKLYGYMKVLHKPEMIQAGKQTYHSADDNRAKKDIAWFAKEFMLENTAYIMGAGTTTKAITDEIGAEKTLLGVDVIKNRKNIMKDVGEKELIQLLKKEKKTKIIVTPIGAQGFVFGRGTQQISPKVIKKVGVKNIIYVATLHKLNTVPHLLVDTGDEQVDKELSGYQQVIVGYRIAQRKDIKAF